MENQTIKCPVCGGTKVQQLSPKRYRCLYCSTTFSCDIKGEPTETPKTTASTSNQASPQIIVVQTPTQSSKPKPKRIRNCKKATAAALAFFGGIVGAQFFYLGKKTLGVLCLLFSCFFITGISIDFYHHDKLDEPITLVLLGCIVFIGFIDGIKYLMMSEEQFDKCYNYEYYY